MNNKKQIKDFFNFLKKNNCLNSYIENLKKNHKYNQFFFVENYRSNFIMGGFTWNNTPEGLDFWVRIHQLWLEEIKKINNG